ncbi:CHAT domain-containing protein [Streptomyces sp. NPDC059568]|uniref:CHAT domain-containing protein n=1 Tax=Streptomyces sp. NPDC059568 TaxID=3346868 RepID=UPI0036838ECA
MSETVRDRLRRMEEAQDPSSALAPEAWKEVERLAKRIRDAGREGRFEDAVESSYLAGLLLWYRYVAGQDRGDFDLAVAYLTVCVVTDPPWPIPDPLLPFVVDSAAVTATSGLETLMDRPSEGIGDQVRLWEHLVQIGPVDGPVRGRCLSHLGIALSIRHQLTHSVDDLRRCLAVERESVEVTSAYHPLWGRLVDNLVLTLGKWSQLAASAPTPSDAISHLDEGIACARDLTETVPDVPAAQPGRCRILNGLGVALRDRATHSGSHADLDDAITVSRRAVDSTPPGDRSSSLHFASLSSTLRMRFVRQRSAADLAEAVDLGKRAVDASSADDPERGQCFTNLAGVLHERYRVDKDPADLAAAASAAREAARVTPPGHRDRAVTLGQLCVVLRDSYLSTGRTGDLNEAAGAAREAVVAAGPGAAQRRSVLVNAALALHACAEHLGDLTAAEEAVAQSREVLRLASGAGNGPVKDLVMLASALETRRRLREERPSAGAAQQDGACPDLDEAIALRRQTIGHSAPNSWEPALHRAQLAAALQRRANIPGRQDGSAASVADLDEAVVHGETAAQSLDEGHADRPAVLANLSDALKHRSQITGSLTDMDRAVSYSRQAVRAMADDHPELLRSRRRLAEALRLRGARQGRMEDLDEAVALGRSAADAARAELSGEAADMLPSLLSDLGDCLRSRSEFTGSSADLNEAIVLGRRAVDATPQDSADRPAMLNRLSAALFRRAKSGSAGDLTEAILMTRSSLASEPADSPLRAVLTANLGGMLWGRYEATADVTALDEAIALGRAVLDETATDDETAGRASNLGAALRLRYERTGDAPSLDEAVALARHAVRLTGPSEPARLKMFFGLGRALGSRAERDASAEDREESARVFAEAAEAPSAQAALAIQAAREAASLLARPTSTDRASRERAAQLLEAAVRRLPQAAPRRLERRDQQSSLAAFSGLAADAAALALNGPAAPSRQAARALQLLEQGRGILISQALDTRSDLTDLEARHPDLAQRFRRLRDELDEIGDTGAVGPPSPGTGTAPYTFPSPIPHDLRARTAAALEATVARIRELPGFEGFLLPPETDFLARQAEQGPIVQINVSDYRSDAILVTKDGIRSLALPGLSLPTVVAQTDAFYAALADAHDPALDAPHRIGAQRKAATVLEWLWDEAARPVLDELGFGPGEGDGPLPRMWWILGGPLSLLPIHAAGRHGGPPDERARHTVMDRVVSSYTPTVRALGHARERVASRTTDRALIVAMPTTPDGEPLPFAAREAERVRRHYPDSRLLVRTPDVMEDRPVKRRVMEELPHCAVAHFACHGHSDPVNPSDDRLLLEDHRTDPLTVAELARHRLGQAQLAYLSACRTALSPAVRLADEAIHLASAFQLAGYPHVIGTLWEVVDEHAADVADAFHSGIAPQHGGIRTARSAYALHDAIRTARDRFPRTPTRWACHVHFGA